MHRKNLKTTLVHHIHHPSYDELVLYQEIQTNHPRLLLQTKLRKRKSPIENGRNYLKKKKLKHGKFEAFFFKLLLFLLIKVGLP